LVTRRTDRQIDRQPVKQTDRQTTSQTDSTFDVYTNVHSHTQTKKSFQTKQCSRFGIFQTAKKKKIYRKWRKDIQIISIASIE